MSEKEAREKLLSLSRKHLSEVLVYLFVALLIWLFGTLVFLPTANQILGQSIPLATSLVILVAFTIFIVKALNRGLMPLLDSASDVLAYEYRNWRNLKTSIKKLQSTVRDIVYIISIFILYLLYSPLLITIHPALNGLMLIPIIIWIMWTIFKIMNKLLFEKEASN
jgi:hypothetical protein